MQLFTLSYGLNSPSIGIVLIGKVIENDLSMSIVFVNYCLKYQCETFYFTCKAMK